MIYFIADLHGTESHDALRRYLDLYKEGDLLVILGDLGLRFRDTEENRAFDAFIMSIDRPIALVDGNHENHPYLRSFPEEDFCGGRVHRISPHIVYLKRGHVFQIADRTFFVMGGCRSTEKWYESGHVYAGEDPSREEIAFAYETLERHNNHVDYVLTHKYKPDMQSDDPYTLDGLVAYIDKRVEFRHWYCGHWHKNERYDERHTIVYDTPIAIE